MGIDIDVVFKIAAIGILLSVLSHVLNKAGRDEMAMMTTLAGVIIVLLMIVNMVSGLFNSVRSIFRLY